MRASRACIAIAGLFATGGLANAQLGPTFVPGETGNRYDLCFPVEAGGRPISNPIPDSSCKLLEFERQDCEAIVRASGKDIVNDPPCLAFRQSDVRPRPVASPRVQ